MYKMDYPHPVSLQGRLGALVLQQILINQTIAFLAAWPTVKTNTSSPPPQQPSIPAASLQSIVRPPSTAPALKLRNKTAYSKVPIHNFWPWIPVTSRHKKTTSTSSPSSPAIKNRDQKTNSAHPKLSAPHLWPWIPIQTPLHKKNKSHFQVPRHNFWPFIPLVASTNQSNDVPVFTKQSPKPPYPLSPNRYNYGEVMYKSMLFYEVQRSGWLPNDRQIKWRGHSALDDHGENGVALAGGWYDAGDYVKFGVPMATATFMLLWGLVEYPDAYKSTGLYDTMLDCVRWPLDYFLKAHPERFLFYGQVGDPYIDHAYWGRPEDMDMERPAFKLTPDEPGSDLIADTSAALTLGYLAFKDIEPSYAKKLLENAIELFEFADLYRGPYTDSIENAWEFYRSYSDEDELAWAAIWLYRATLNMRYLHKAQNYASAMDGCWAQSWADKACSVPVLLYQMTKEPSYKRQVESIMSEWLPGGDVDYTPKGLAYRGPWGTLRYTANMAFVALRASDLGIKTERYRKWAMDQIHYMLGEGGRSYVVGYGHNPPSRPHHASSSCPVPPEPCSWDDFSKPGPNVHTLFGALVGGPDMNDEYVDTRSGYIHNEVGCEYNAGFQSAVAALRSLELRWPPVKIS